MDIRPTFGAACVLLALIMSGRAVADAPPCPTTLVERPGQDPVTGMETEASRASRGELEMVVDILTNYAGCSEDIPGFAAKFGPSYQEWRRKNGTAIARYEQNARARRMVECRTQAERRRAGNDTPQGNAYKVKMCDQIIGPAIQKLNSQ